ncbi:putative glycerol kinase 5 [Armadillidium nasatum]|uniref:Putative glycerol kinase 5 n=1 Tax=Armadillidium nasatum TaxID=96803 RepID=A0A5N5T788_9CRUS|nr:putative glycerol kinase 5 [Armadillidium nasatum]
MNNAPESDEKLLIKHDSKYYIMSCDIGTSSLRCIIYNEKAIKICTTHEKIKLLCPQPVSNLAASEITCLGLSTQRASFMLWDKITGEPFHNFITWKDVRADTMINDWNSSLLMKAVRLGTGFLYHIMRKKRYLAASILKFQNTHVNMRLKWILENNKKVKEAINKKTLMFGTIDTWLVYQLTNGKVYATDPSNASGTGIYDPYLKEWSGFLIKLINLPKDIFPKVRNTYGKLADISPQHFGASIPITAVISDQGAAMFGGCGFDQGDVKITLGTGAFFDLNTGHEPHTSINGIYPVIGWEDETGIIYMAEGSSNDNGTVIQWGKDMKLYDDYAETSALAESVSDSGGVYFIPSFQGLQVRKYFFN